MSQSSKELVKCLRDALRINAEQVEKRGGDVTAAKKGFAGFCNPQGIKAIEHVDMGEGCVFLLDIDKSRYLLSIVTKPETRLATPPQMIAPVVQREVLWAEITVIPYVEDFTPVKQEEMRSLLLALYDSGFVWSDYQLHQVKFVGEAPMLVDRNAAEPKSVADAGVLAARYVDPERQLPRIVGKNVPVKTREGKSIFVPFDSIDTYFTLLKKQKPYSQFDYEGEQKRYRELHKIDPQRVNLLLTAPLMTAMLDYALTFSIFKKLVMNSGLNADGLQIMARFLESEREIADVIPLSKWVDLAAKGLKKNAA